MRVPRFLLPPLFLSLIVSAQAALAADALELLSRANDAARKLNYTGTYVYHHGQHSEVLSVSHRVDAAGERQKVEVLDGPRREFLRINNEVYCQMTDGKNVRVDKNAIQRLFPAVLPDNTDLLARYYVPKRIGGEKVAGRDCHVIVLEPRDHYRFAQMIWLDRQSLLPLKIKTIDNNGSFVSMSVFTEIEIGRKPDDEIFDVRITSKQAPLALQSSGKMSDDKWAVEAPPGYVPVLETVRALQGRKMPVLHRVYSDGMSNISVFIEPIVQGSANLDGLSTESAINIYSRQVAGHKVTAMGEVPAAALLKTANSIRKK